MSKSKTRAILSPRDLSILRAVWKWKVLSMEEIKLICFDKVSDFAVWKRLRKLGRAHILEKKSTDLSKKSLWVLGYKGFEVLREFIDELKENGYGSEKIDHDYLVTQFHVGFFLANPEVYVEYFTEQEMSRKAYENFPIWVPQTEVHRCDGLLRVKRNQDFEVIALEVELSLKAKVRYESLAEFYEEQPKIDQVLWLVRDKQMGRKILATMDSKRRQRPNIHGFVDYEDFKANRWNAKVFLGYRSGTSVAELFGGIQSVKG